MSWARQLKRVFHIDVERCAFGGRLKILAAIEEPVVIVGILTAPGPGCARAAALQMSLDHEA
jgi:hypothetical protein